MQFFFILLFFILTHAISSFVSIHAWGMHLPSVLYISATTFSSSPSGLSNLLIPLNLESSFRVWKLVLLLVLHLHDSWIFSFFTSFTNCFLFLTKILKNTTTMHLMPTRRIPVKDVHTTIPVRGSCWTVCDINLFNNFCAGWFASSGITPIQVFYTSSREGNYCTRGFNNSEIP